MRAAIVVGSGAGGATVAKDLQGAFDVTVLEAGKAFRRAGLERETIERLRRSHVLVDERLLRLAYPPIRVRKTPDMLLVNGIGTGGTTTMATGNGIRLDGDLRALGIDLTPEFEELSREIPVTADHQRGWRQTTRRLFGVCEEMGLHPFPTPKMGSAGLCRHCGRCMLGCPHGVKWDSRRFLEVAVARGARLLTGHTVDRIVIEAGRAIGVLTKGTLGHRFHAADLIVLAAGGFGTPVILERSGIDCEPRLFVDPVLTVAAHRPRAWQCNEIEMPFVIRRDHYILSPYFDWLSFLFNRDWRYPIQDIVGIMIKLADENVGTISRGRIVKPLTALDRSRLDEGVGIATEILERFDAEPGSIFLGTINAGHPGGMLPLTEETAMSFHDERLPDNVYVADSTLFPRSLGNPPILTIVAMAKRVARLCTKLAETRSSGLLVGRTS